MGSSWVHVWVPTKDTEFGLWPHKTDSRQEQKQAETERKTSPRFAQTLEAVEEVNEDDQVQVI